MMHSEILYKVVRSGRFGPCFRIGKAQSNAMVNTRRFGGSQTILRQTKLLLLLELELVEVLLEDELVLA